MRPLILLLLLLLLCPGSLRGQGNMPPSPNRLPTGFYPTNISYSLTNYNTNVIYAAGAGTTADNGAYNFFASWSYGWTYSNAATHALFNSDFSGSEDAPWSFNSATGTNTEDGNEDYFNAGVKYIDGWTKNAGTLPVPTANFATNITAQSTLAFVSTNLLSWYCFAGSYLPAVLNAAPAGATIEVYPGTYNANNLLKNGVNWYFHPGANIFYTDQDTTYWQAEDTPGFFGIFTDCGQGPCTNTILGDSFDFRTTHSSFPGVLYLTNPVSRVSLKCREMSGRVWGTGWGNILTSSRSLVTISNCAWCQISCNLASTTNTDTSYTLQVSQFQPPSSTTGVQPNGFTWQSGATYINCDDNYCPGAQAIWSWGVNAADSSWFYRGQYLLGNIYSDAAANFHSISWYNIDYIDASSSIFQAIGLYGGKNYVTALKAIATNGNPVVSIDAGSSNWITIQKISGQAAPYFGIQTPVFANVPNGATWANIEQFEEVTAPCSGIVDLVTNNHNFYLTGLSANCTSNFVIQHYANERVIQGLNINTSAGTNWPILIHTNGVILRNCNLVAPSGVAPIATPGTTNESITVIATSQNGANGAHVLLLGSITTNAVVGGATLRITNGLVGAASIP